MPQIWTPSYRHLIVDTEKLKYELSNNSGQAEYEMEFVKFGF
jgi:hypothetical protein